MDLNQHDQQAKMPAGANFAGAKIHRPDFDVVVIGSGFGGSVSALRLAERGHRVLVVEEGSRFRDQDFARSNYDLKKFLWAPLLRCFGIQAITPLKGVWILHGKGVGGGSLVYANTLMEPRAAAFANTSWPAGIDWRAELAEHYATSKRMLGVTQNPMIEEAERVLRKVGEDLGCAESFHPTSVGVYFGKSEADPYFDGQGPIRTPCNGCGSCMVGCRVGAKNTLVKNYLWFAEKRGAEIRSDRRVERVEPFAQGWRIQLRSPRDGSRETVQAHRVVVAAGVIGTLSLLLKMKAEGVLPKISPALGLDVRTNGESLVGATSLASAKASGVVDYSKGIAIGAAIHPDENTKIESVKYPRGSDVMRWLAIPLTPNGSLVTRPLKLVWRLFVSFPQFIRLLMVRDWSVRSVILLVMQTTEDKISLTWSRGVFGFRLARLGAEKLPSYLPIAQEAVISLARRMKGIPQNVISETLLGTPATAHILGGCRIGNDQSVAVVNSSHEVFGYPGLYVCDGSVIPANLGVNPSLTITAMAERFTSLFPPPETRSELKS